MSNRTKDKNCGNCVFHDRESPPTHKFNKPWRQCKGWFPSLEPNPQFGIARGAFPYMPDDGWCGQHSPVAPPPPVTGVEVISVTVVP
jgi:hypothetical protein